MPSARPIDLDHLTPIDIARANWPVNCSRCGSNSVRVLEKRPNRAAIRRRKHCSACGHRETTYEISQKQFKEWKTIEKLGMQLREVLLGKSEKSAVAASDSGIQCPTCRHWSGKRCDFEFPEAGGRFAEECLMYGKRP